MSQCEPASRLEWGFVESEGIELGVIILEIHLTPKEEDFATFPVILGLATKEMPSQAGCSSQSESHSPKSQV